LAEDISTDYRLQIIFKKMWTTGGIMGTTFEYNS